MQPKHSFLRMLFDSLLFIFFGAVFFWSFPLNFIVWGIYNRKTVNPFISILLVALSLITVSLLLNFTSPIRSSITFKDIAGSGIYITYLFSISRIARYVVLEQSTKIRKYWCGCVLVANYIAFVPVPFIVIHLFPPHLAKEALLRLFLLEISLLLWSGLVIFLLVKYPKDDLMTHRLERLNQQYRLVQGPKK